MTMAGDYIRAHKAMCEVVEKSFRRMAKHCEFRKNYSDSMGNRCFYKDGSTNDGVCAREICPVLEEE